MSKAFDKIHEGLTEALVVAKTSDPYAAAIEAWAYATACDRHLRHMRGCAWRDNAPCACRAAVAGIWLEYAS